MNRKSLVILFIFITMNIFAQVIPTDPELRIGQLDNGFTYYIKHNSYQKGKLNLQLVNKIGAVLEEKHEDGMAHFLEHMAFNGSKNYPDYSLREYLDNIGVEYNAHTRLESTEYVLNNIPVDVEGAVDNCILMAYDWCSGLNLDEDAIIKEKGIIKEEKRMIEDAQFRTLNILRNSVVNHSKYFSSTIIGKEDVFMNFTSKELKLFYDKWYRPDMHTIIIVGDIEPDEIENKIINIFKNIPSSFETIEYPVICFENDVIIEPFIVNDKEITTPIFSLDFLDKPFTKEEKSTVDWFVKKYLINIIRIITDERLKGILPKSYGLSNNLTVSHEPFLGISQIETFNISTMIENENINESIKSLLIEIWRIIKYGFTNTEYERAKLTLISKHKDALNENMRTESSIYSEKYKRHFLVGDYIPQIALECRLLSELMPQVTLEVLNEHIKEVFTEKNAILSLITSETFDNPSKQDLLEWFTEIEQSEIEPYTEVEDNEPLLTTIPVSGKIVSESSENAFGTTNFKLSNGATVVIKQTDFKNNEIMFSATSIGGTSLFPENKIGNIKLYEEAIALGGVGNYSRTELQKKLVGKNIVLEPTINLISEGLKGSTPIEHLEELLQLVYLQFTSPRMDHNAFSVLIEKNEKILQNESPQFLYNKAVKHILYANSQRMHPITLEELSTIDYQEIFEWREHKYADASDFTFIFVGNINPDKCRHLIERYIASLPSLSKKESIADVDVSIQTGRLKKIIDLSLENPQAVILNMFSTKMELNLHNRVIIAVLVDILKSHLINTLREQEGGTYAINVSGGISEYPKGQTTLQISFPTELGKEEYLNNLIKSIIDHIVLNGPTIEELNRSINTLYNSHLSDMKSNEYWRSSIAAYYITGVNSVNGYIDLLKSVNKEDIKSALSKLTKDNLIEIIMKGR